MLDNIIIFTGIFLILAYIIYDAFFKIKEL